MSPRALLGALVARIPAHALHLVAAVVPEAVLGTKEPSEKARTAAFDLVVAMGRKMSAGGVVRRDQIHDMDEAAAVEGTWISFTDAEKCSYVLEPSCR